MAVKADYYKVLDIPRDASDEAIRDAYKGQLRKWRKGTTSSDQSRRHEAENKMALLKEANAVLSDPAQRAAYTQRLINEGVESPRSAQTQGDSTTDWVEVARQALADGDYHSAAYAAREATHTIGNSAESWKLRSRANAGLEQLDDALYEARQSTIIAPNDADCQYQYGSVAELIGKLDIALEAYQTAMRLEVSEPQYVAAVAGVYADNGHVDDAISLLESKRAQFNGNELINDYLAMAYLTKAERVPAVREADGYTVTSAEEIVLMRDLVRRAVSLTQDQSVREWANGIEAYLQRVEKKTIHLPFNELRLSIFFVSLPAVLFLFALLFNALILILPALGMAALVYYVCWVPGWKKNKRIQKAMMRG